MTIITDPDELDITFITEVISIGETEHAVTVSDMLRFLDGVIHGENYSSKKVNWKQEGF